MKIIKENEIPRKEAGKYDTELAQFLSTGEKFCILDKFGNDTVTARTGYYYAIKRRHYPVEVFVRKGTVYAERIEERESK